MFVQLSWVWATGPVPIRIPCLVTYAKVVLSYVPSDCDVQKGACGGWCWRGRLVAMWCGFLPFVAHPQAPAPPPTVPLLDPRILPRRMSLPVTIKNERIGPNTSGCVTLVRLVPKGLCLKSIPSQVTKDRPFGIGGTCPYWLVGIVWTETLVRTGD